MGACAVSSYYSTNQGIQRPVTHTSILWPALYCSHRSWLRRPHPCSRRSPQAKPLGGVKSYSGCRRVRKVQSAGQHLRGVPSSRQGARRHPALSEEEGLSFRPVTMARRSSTPSRSRRRCSPSLATFSKWIRGLWTAYIDNVAGQCTLKKGFWRSTSVHVD